MSSTTVCEDSCMLDLLFRGSGFKNWKSGACKVHGNGDGKPGEV